MVNEINLALFGSGYWGSKLASEYIQLDKEYPNFNFVGIVDPDKERLASIKNKLGLPSDKLFTDVEGCLEDSKINAIHIATPNETHYRIAYEGLSNNKHVLLEKPMSLNGQDAFKLARHAEKTGRVLLVGHIFRFNEALVRAKELLDKGVIGDIYYLNLNWTDYLDPLPLRDIILDLMPHPVDILNYLTDEWPSLVYAHSVSYKRPDEKEREDMAFVTVEMPDRKSSQITLSWLQRGPRERNVTIVGSKGTMKIDTLLQEVVCYDQSSKHDVAVTKNNTMKSMILHFIKCILGQENPNNSSLIGAMTVNVLASTRRSLTEKKAVAVLD